MKFKTPRFCGAFFCAPNEVMFQRLPQRSNLLTLQQTLVKTLATNFDGDHDEESLRLSRRGLGGAPP